ncbi:MAG: hypothetical protein JHC26_06595 [Thermofilum sp.]|uniref:hypothetical protein n=1 Tax=Thermofilum sp. TaxID=1961369 RepID=UPI00258F9881|nr:hypothetical protein [Thermofilum sp.]MCI4408742.1 hypothetical protein [Thermofilum sp.]
MSPPSMKLHNLLEVALGKKSPWDERKSDEFIYGVCLASSIDEKRCDEIYENVHNTMYGYLFDVDQKTRENAVRGVKEVMDRFEVKGSCLVERGVKIEDPSVCEGDINERLTVIGSRMQFSVDSSFHNIAIRSNGSCAVSISEDSPFRSLNIRELRAGKPRLIGYDEVGASFMVGQCGLSDLPNLVKDAEKLNYGDVYYDCRINTDWDDEYKSPEVEDAEYEAIDEEYEDMLRILRGEKTNG